MIDRGCGRECGRGLVWLGLCDWTYREDEIIWFLLAFAAMGLMGCVGVEILVCEGGGSRRRFGVWIVGLLLGNFELKRKPSTPRVKLYRVVCEEGKVFGANRLVVSGTPPLFRVWTFCSSLSKTNAACTENYTIRTCLGEWGVHLRRIITHI